MVTARRFAGSVPLLQMARMLQLGSEAMGTNENKQTVQKYLEAFAQSDHAEVLSCLTDDVEWVIPGSLQLTGKEAFAEAIENDAFVGSPTIRVTRMIAERDVVVAEGTARSERKAGGALNAVFCDVFEMRDARIRRLTSYLMEVAE